MEKEISVPQLLVEKYDTNKIIKYVSQELSSSHAALVEAVKTGDAGVIGVAVASQDLAIGTLLALNRKLNGNEISVLG